MTVGCIDSASIMNAVGALVSHKKYHPENYREWNEWTNDSIAHVAMRLITHGEIEIPTGPLPDVCGLSPYSTLTRCYDKAIDGLKILDRYQRVPGDIHFPVANSLFKNWLIENADELPVIIQKTQAESSYHGWIKWAIAEAWVDDSRRMNGLFNENMVSTLSPILCVSETKLKNLLIETRDPAQVKKWSEGHDLNRNFDLAKEAYVASAILRGKFHEKISVVQGKGGIRHPIRGYLPIETDAPEITEYTCPKALEFMINIINKHALIETTPEDRINHWINNILKIRNAYVRKNLDNAFYWDQNFENHEVFKIVMGTIDKFELIMHRKPLEDKFETMVMAGIGAGIALSSYCLNLPWAVDPLSTIVIAGLSSAASDCVIRRLEKKKDIGRSLAEKIEKLTRNEDSLYNLATASPGLVIHKK